MLKFKEMHLLMKKQKAKPFEEVKAKSDADVVSLACPSK